MNNNKRKYNTLYSKANVGNKILFVSNNEIIIALCIGVYDNTGDVRTSEGMIEYGRYIIVPDTILVGYQKDGYFFKASKQTIADYINDGYQYDENGNLYHY